MPFADHQKKKLLILFAQKNLDDNVDESDPLRCNGRKKQVWGPGRMQPAGLSLAMSIIHHKISYFITHSNLAGIGYSIGVVLAVKNKFWL